MKFLAALFLVRGGCCRRRLPLCNLVIIFLLGHFPIAQATNTDINTKTDTDNSTPCALLLEGQAVSTFWDFAQALCKTKFIDRDLVIQITNDDKDNIGCERMRLVMGFLREQDARFTQVWDIQIRSKIVNTSELDLWLRSLEVVLPMIGRIEASTSVRHDSGFVDREPHEDTLPLVPDLLQELDHRDIEFEAFVKKLQPYKGLGLTPFPFPSERNSAIYKVSADEAQDKQNVFVQPDVYRLLELSPASSRSAKTALRYRELYSRVAHALDFDGTTTSRVSLDNVHSEVQLSAAVVTRVPYKAKPATLTEIERCLHQDPMLKPRLEMLQALTGVRLQVADFYLVGSGNFQRLNVFVINLPRITKGMIDLRQNPSIVDLSAIPSHLLDRYAAGIEKLRHRINRNEEFGISLTDLEYNILQKRAVQIGLFFTPPN